MAEPWLRLCIIVVLLGVIFGYPFSSRTNYVYNRPDHAVTEDHALETTDTTPSLEFWEAEGEAIGAEDVRENESGYEPSDETDDENLDENQAEQTVTESVIDSNDYRKMSEHNPGVNTAQEGAGKIEQSASDAENVGDYGTDDGPGSELESTEYFPHNDEAASESSNDETDSESSVTNDLTTTENVLVVVTAGPIAFWPEEEIAVQKARWDEAGGQSGLNDPPRTNVHGDGTERGVTVSSTGRVSAAFILPDLLTMAVCSFLITM